MTIKYLDSKRISGSETRTDLTWNSGTAVNTTINGSTATYDGSGWNAVAQTNETITLGESVEWTTSGYSGMIGIGKGSLGTSYQDIDYAIYSIGTGTQYNTHESGTVKLPTVTESWTSSTVWKITISDSGIVTYYKDNVLIYTSLVTASGNYDVRYAGVQNGTATPNSLKSDKKDLTNVQDNSIYIETDTAERYWFQNKLTFEDDFTSYTSQPSADTAWVSSDTAENRVNITNDNMDCGFPTDQTNNAISHDLTSVSDSAWVCRFKIRFSALNMAAQANFWAGLSSLDSSSNSGASHNFIGIQTDNANYGSQEKDGQALTGEGGQNNQSITWATDTDYYFEITRLTTTTFQVKLFSDSAYSTQVGSTSSGTCPSTVTGLRYIKFTNAITSGSGDWTGTIDDIEFYNNTTVAQKWFPTFQDHFNTDRWAATGTDVSVSTTDKRLDFNIPNTANQTDAITYDLTSVSDSAWVLRFKIVMDDYSFNTTGNAKKLLIGLSSTSHSTDVDSAQDAIGILFGSWDNGTSKIRSRDSNGASWMGGSGTDFSEAFVDNETYYVEIKRTLPTAYTVSLYSDSSYSTLIEAKSETMGATDTTGLQYLKVGIDTTAGAPSGNFAGYIDDVEFFNGVTSI